MKLLILISFTFFLGSLEGKHWALIVAGSNGYYNYRHQADTCHAYQVLHKHGIPDENIVVMMYDDIANNSANPTPGIIINKPNGPNVYDGVLKDYTGYDVTPKNFLNILKGDKKAMNGIGSGKVIDSGPDDNVFVYFADHGAPNLIAFPTRELHAVDLQKAILYMHANKKYNKMVFYVEACESGSMFNRHKLPANINVFATTAANGEESSYACYWDDRRHTYLGDVYSVKWLEDSDKASFSKETLTEQFKTVKKETNTSHVQEFGDLSMGQLTLAIFQGEGTYDDSVTSKETEASSIADAVPSPMVPLMTLFNRIRAAKTPAEKEFYQMELQKLQKMNAKIHETIKTIVQNLVLSKHKQSHFLSKPATPIVPQCYKEAVSEFRTSCFDFNKHEHALRHVYVLANLCDAGIPTFRILKAINKACPIAY